MAEGILRAAVKGREDIAVASAGVGTVHGQPPSPHGVEVLRPWGIDISRIRSQPLTATLVDRATHIFAMTGAHLETIHLLFPHGAEKSYLLREFEESGTTVWRDVPDPIGLGRDMREQAPEMVCSTLLTLWAMPPAS